MGLKVENISLYNFRCFSSKIINLSAEISIFVGNNAAGKTNTIEALQLLTAGYSFRKSLPSQLILEGAPEAKIEVSLVGDGRKLENTCSIKEKRKQFFKNGKKCHTSDISGTLMSILFNPDDLLMIKGGALHRRDELDNFARQANKSYFNVLSSYNKTVEQRNKLLKTEWPDESLLDAWDVSLARGGSTLLHARLHLFARLAKKTCAIYQKLSGGEKLSMRYISSLGTIDKQNSREEITQIFLQVLSQVRLEDIRRKQTTKGPHRDDIEFLIENRDVKNFGSQGQIRTVVLALKMAEVLLSEELLGEKPLLLLDDVMSELDESRRKAIMDFIFHDIQTIITTTNLGYFSDETLRSAQIVRFSND